MDLLGSPEPQTPMYQRRKRAEVATQARKEVRSSVYGGLEKETSNMFVSMGSDKENTSSNGQAMVHEGPVSTVLCLSSKAK